jgi:hypothetical protein
MIVNTHMTPTLGIRISTTYSIPGYRNNHTTVNFHSKVTNDDGQERKYLPIPVPFLIAKTTMNEHLAMVSCTFL